MDEFIRGRRIGEEVIERLREDKVNMLCMKTTIDASIVCYP